MNAIFAGSLRPQTNAVHKHEVNVMLYRIIGDNYNAGAWGSCDIGGTKGKER